MSEEVRTDLFRMLQEAQVAVNLLDVVFAPTLVFLDNKVKLKKILQNVNNLIRALNFLELRCECVRSTFLEKQELGQI